MSASLEVKPAVWPRDRRAAVHLLTRYREFLLRNPAGAIAIPVQDFKRELEALERLYEGETAVLLLAWCGETACGCAAVRMLHSRPRAAEVKRLFVSPRARGSGAGRALMEACAKWARKRQAAELLLDTVPAAMPDAVRLYRSMGFAETERYHDGGLPGLVFFRLGLEYIVAA